jgi:hypothetical protein
MQNKKRFKFTKKPTVYFLSNTRDKSVKLITIQAVKKRHNSKDCAFIVSPVVAQHSFTL